MFKKISIVFIVIVAFVLCFSSLFFVYEDEYAFVYRFNRVITVHSEPGVKFKVPFLDTKTTIKKNYQLYDMNPSEVLTKDKKTMTVDSFIIWKISEPMKYIQNIDTSASDTSGAEYKLDSIVYNAIKNNLSTVNQDVAISRDEQLSENILNDVASGLSTYGMEAIDIQIKQLDLPDENKSAVYNRMISERNQIAATYTAEGKEEAEKIRNSTDKETAIILAEASATAEEIIATGESEYMRILSEAYNTEEKKSFYEYIRSLDALKVTMEQSEANGEKTIVLPLDSEIGKLFIGQE
ncbi:MAG: protease modulator HflC [Lachnospirales bacterium]